MTFFTQLEPDSLIQLFSHYPPEQFKVSATETGLPTFSMQFNLLTTMEVETQNKLKRKLLYKVWSKWLNIQTEFVGTTVSEYALLNNSHLPAELVQSILSHYNRSYPLLIVKDVPVDSPFLTDSQNKDAKNLAEAFKHKHFIEVEGQALAYVPIDFDSMEDYFKRFSHSRRKNYRRKLRTKEKLSMQEISSGDPQFFDEAVLNHYYELYLKVFEQSEIHFDKLSFDFFKALLQQNEPTCKIITYSHQDQLIGYNICYFIQNRLVDKYIGLDYPKAKELNLYFVSWFYNLELAKRLNADVYIAGWTDPEIKAQLGASFTFTKHYVFIRNGILKRILFRFKSLFESDSAFKTLERKEVENESSPKKEENHD